MSTALVAAVLGIALVDALNPSAIAMTSYLVSRPDPWPAVRGYLAGIFTTYLSVGLVVVFTMSSVVDRAIDAVRSPAVASSVQVVAGGVIVVLVGRTWARRSAQRPAVPAALGPGRSFVLGVTITALEATTALPYLGALAAIVRADLAGFHAVVLLVAYNLVFVAPPIALAVTARWSGDHVERLRTRVGDLLRPGRPARLVAQVAGIVVGAGLLVDGVARLLTAQLDS